MNYTKPEVAVLGTAVRVIEQIPTQKRSTSVDGGVAPNNKPTPAYDLDE